MSTEINKYKSIIYGYSGRRYLKLAGGGGRKTGKGCFIKIMVANLVGKNKHVAYVANLCFRNAMFSSGRNINKIMSEYKLDYRLLQLAHIFNIKANMDIMYKDNISSQIYGEEWKINMILEIVNCLNVLRENNFTYDLYDICIIGHINIKYFILFYLVNHFIINVYSYCTISLKICLSTNK